MSTIRLPNKSLLHNSFGCESEQVNCSHIIRLYSGNFSLCILPVLESYRCERTWSVRYDGCNSTLIDCKSRVPQGSILGPLLFSVYTSHFVEFVDRCKIHMYADYIQLILIFNSVLYYDYFTAKTLIKKIPKVSDNHSLILNPKKSSLLFFSNKTKSHEIEKKHLNQD